MTTAVIGSLVIAAVSTFGDFVWAGFHLRHRQLYGLTHGTLLFLVIGLFLGVARRRPVLGAVAGAAIGFVAAESFYLLAPIAGYAVMFFVWMFIWLALAFLWGRVLRIPPLSTRNVALRALAAAMGSGVGFYLISGIWRPFNPRGWDYAVHYISWTIAYLPGFLALTLDALPFFDSDHRDRRDRRVAEGS